MPTLKIKGHERFAQAIAAGKSGTDAYLSAGYALARDAAARNAYRLRKRPDVAARIAELTRGAPQALEQALRMPEPAAAAAATPVAQKPKHPGGRPSLYRPEYAAQALRYTLLGASDEELARAFGVSDKTIYDWKVAHPEFLRAIQDGKLEADGRIAHSLYHRAKGYSWTEQQAFKVKAGKDVEDVKIVKVERQVPPDTAAAFIWLKNRRRHQWRDRHEIEHNNRYADMNEEQRLAWAQSIYDRAMRLLGTPTIEHEPEDEE